MDWTAVVVAVVAAGPLYLVQLRNNKLTRDSHKILKGNGKGTVDKMLEEVLTWQGTHAVEDEGRFARLEGALKSVARKASIATAVATVNDGDAREARG